MQVLVVHGIGQAMKRVELGVTQLKSIVECCDTMRSNTEEIDLQQQQQPPQQSSSSGEGGDKAGAGAGGVGRVEYIPVEWHTKFRERAGESEEVRGYRRVACMACGWMDGCVSVDGPD